MTEDSATWKAIVAKYRHQNAWIATRQLVNTLGSYLLIVALYSYCASISWWLAIPLALLAGGFLVRIFVIFHDCGHGSFFQSQRANDFWGPICGLLTFTPYLNWRSEHAIHHGTAGDLDRRGTGDIWTLTVAEYLAASRWKRFSYRLARNPFILFVIGPLVMFLIVQRVPSARAGKRERRSVWLMNLAIVVMSVAMSALIGVGNYVVLQLCSMALAASTGVWLFYVQHQFEDAYWTRSKDWDYAIAAMKGSSYFKLPKVLQWFSGNIGFHHIHHLNPRIPNYNLERCHKSHSEFQQVKAIALLDSLKTMSLKLWDESSGKLVSFRHLAKLQSSAAR
jgi:acyl-lipid omega-6 desaturase (Delta-12 desaturase)